MKQKVKKKFYKKWWFWVIAIIIIISVFGGQDNESTVSTALDSPPKDGQIVEKEEDKLLKVTGDLKLEIKDTKVVATIESNIVDGGIFEVAIMNENLDIQSEFIAIENGMITKEFDIPEEWGASYISGMAMLRFNVTDKPQPNEIKEIYGENGENIKGKLAEENNVNGKNVILKTVTIAYPDEETVIKAKEAEELKAWNEFVERNTKKLIAGQHEVGKHLESGMYNITFNGSGNLFIYDENGSNITNEIGGSDLGISKYRAIIPDGGNVEISGMSINIIPTKSTLQPYGNTELYAGYWLVGKDITEGRYKFSTSSGSGNLFVYSSEGMVKTNEILGGDWGVQEVLVNLKDGDLIKIAGLNKVNLITEN